MSQSKKHSAIEAFSNVVIGYAVAVISQIIIFPFFDIHVSLEENIIIGIFFTVISLVRSYFIRRLFNRLHTTRNGGI